MNAKEILPCTCSAWLTRSDCPFHNYGQKVQCEFDRLNAIIDGLELLLKNSKQSNEEAAADHQKT